MKHSVVRRGMAGGGVVRCPPHEVIELSYDRGFSVGEIAAHLGEPKSGARELLRTGMQELRAVLAGSAILEDHVVTRA